MIMRADEIIGQIKFVRVKDPEAALVLLPWYVEEGIEGNAQRHQLGAALYERMSEYPEDTFVVLIFEDMELKAFGVAYCRKEDVCIWQVGSKGLNRKVIDIGFDIIKSWAKSKGFLRIVAQPNRDNFKIYKRRWGFEKANETDVALEI